MDLQKGAILFLHPSVFKCAVKRFSKCTERLALPRSVAVVAQLQVARGADAPPAFALLASKADDCRRCTGGLGKVRAPRLSQK